MDELLKHKTIIFEAVSLEHEAKSVILVERELDKLWKEYCTGKSVFGRTGRGVD